MVQCGVGLVINDHCSTAALQHCSLQPGPVITHRMQPPLNTKTVTYMQRRRAACSTAALQHCSTRYTGPGDGAVCWITLLIWREFICNTGAVFPIPHRYSQCYPQNLKLLLLYFEDFTEWARFRSFYWLKKRNTQKMAVGSMING